MDSNYTGPQHTPQAGQQYVTREQIDRKYDLVNKYAFRAFLIGSFLTLSIFSANKINNYNQRKEIEKLRTDNVTRYEDVSVTLKGLEIAERIFSARPDYKFTDELDKLPYKTKELEEELKRLQESDNPTDTKNSLDRLIGECKIDSVILANESDVKKYNDYSNKLYTQEEANNLAAQLQTFALALLCNYIELKSDKKRKDAHKKRIADLVR